jgi:preprotein translocase subunit SecD
MKLSYYKNCGLVLLVLLAIVYAMPNLFADYPVVQITAIDNALPVDQELLNKITPALERAAIYYAASPDINQQLHQLILRFKDTDPQLKAKDVIQKTLNNKYLVALNLAPAVPVWLKALQATPMKLGLDLRGGVHFLLQIDVASVVKQRLDGDLQKITQELRNAKIRYTAAKHRDLTIELQFLDRNNLNHASLTLNKNHPDFAWQTIITDQHHQTTNCLVAQLNPQTLLTIKHAIVAQAMDVLRKRVNELGIAEAIVQQQGDTKVVVDLPGVQDTSQAKNILGKTATLEFHVVDEANSIMDNSSIPFGDSRYDFSGQTLLLKNTVALRGSAIVNADFATSEEDGRPVVKIRLNGAGSNLFSKITAENIGKRMAVVYVEIKSTNTVVAGKPVITYNTSKQIISAPIIQGALGNNFQITGIANLTEARNLALLLRAGSLPAPVTIIAERQLGPSLGQQNIQRGILSLVVGTVLVMLFMVCYYRVMGLIADIALLINLVMIVALLSILGATLTLPGIAGIVLTMGMAIDANILIFERIREELRNGVNSTASISLGYEKAFNTIFDANSTTLIVAMVLFSLGSSVVKGVAVTLTVGIITSMFTAITLTRAIVNYYYNRHNHNKISIGI